MLPGLEINSVARYENAVAHLVVLYGKFNNCPAWARDRHLSRKAWCAAQSKRALRRSRRENESRSLHAENQKGSVIEKRLSLKSVGVCTNGGPGTLQQSQWKVRCRAPRAQHVTNAEKRRLQPIGSRATQLPCRTHESAAGRRAQGTRALVSAPAGSTPDVRPKSGECSRSAEQDHGTSGQKLRNHLSEWQDRSLHTAFRMFLATCWFLLSSQCSSSGNFTMLDL